MKQPGSIQLQMIVKSNNVTKLIETNLSLTTLQYKRKKLFTLPQYSTNEGDTGLRGSSVVLNKPCLQIKTYMRVALHMIASKNQVDFTL